VTGAATHLQRLGLQAILPESGPARALRNTRSLREVQDAIVALGLASEIEYEQTKARGLPTQEPNVDCARLIRAIDRVSQDAAARSVDLLSLRRLAEALSLTGSGCGTSGGPQAVAPERIRPPVWVVRSIAWPVEFRPGAPCLGGIGPPERVNNKKP
jgi:hypothetical protein